MELDQPFNNFLTEDDLAASRERGSQRIFGATIIRAIEDYQQYERPGRLKKGLPLNSLEFLNCALVREHLVGIGIDPDIFLESLETHTLIRSKHNTNNGQRLYWVRNEDLNIE